MKIKEFADSKAITTQSVSMYISRHQAEFDGHVTRTGRETILDDTALKILNDHFADPTKIEVVPDSEIIKQQREEIAALSAQLQAMTLKMAGMLDDVALAKEQKYLIEDQQKKIADQQRAAEEREQRLQAEQEARHQAEMAQQKAELERDQAEQARKNAEEERNREKDARSEAEAEVSRLRNRGFFERLFNK